MDMEEFGTVWRMAVAVLAVWRLSRLLFQDESGPGRPPLGRIRADGLLGGRLMDLIYWLHVWLSAQTAVWVACGFAGVFVSWVAASGVARAMSGRAGISSPSQNDSAQPEAMPSALQEAAQ
jgi:hypothetical protein